MVRQEVAEADLVAVLRTMALPRGFSRAVDRAVAARLRTFGETQTVSAAALAAPQKRIDQMFKVGSEAEWETEHREIEAQRTRLTVKPAPLFDQSVLRTLVDERDGMTAEERERMLAAIFDSVTGARRVDRLEPCEDWRLYVIAAIPKPVNVVPAANRAEDGSQGRS